MFIYLYTFVYWYIRTFCVIYSCLDASDVLLIYDGRSAKDPLIGRICNDLKSIRYLSTGPDMYIEFYSGSSRYPNAQGFRINYKFRSNPVFRAHINANILPEKHPGSDGSSGSRDAYSKGKLQEILIEDTYTRA